MAIIEEQKNIPLRQQSYYFDGKKSFYRPVDSPTIFQVEQTGAVILSQYLYPKEELPLAQANASTSRSSTSQSSNDSEVQAWIKRLNDHKLTYMSSYSSSSYDGSYVGGSEKQIYALCAKGTFRYYGHSNVSVDVGSSGYGHNTQRDRGNWSIRKNNGGEIELVLDYTDNSQTVLVLSREDGKTYVDGSRYYRTDLHNDNSFQDYCE